MKCFYNVNSLYIHHRIMPSLYVTQNLCIILYKTRLIFTKFMDSRPNAEDSGSRPDHSICTASIKKISLSSLTSLYWSGIPPIRENSKRKSVWRLQGDNSTNLDIILRSPNKLITLIWTSGSS